MAGRFDEFMSSVEGQAIADVIAKGGKDRVVEFKAFSREGFPAVTALVSELRPLLEPLKKSDPKKFNFAKQCVGDEVGKIMRAQGYENKKSRSVPGKLFAVGAVWTVKP